MFFLIVWIATVYAYFEQKLIRHAINISETINLTNIMTSNEKISKCPQKIIKIESSSTFLTEICIQKNLFFNIELVIGDELDKDSVFEMFIDLTSPWSWYKNDSCKWYSKPSKKFDGYETSTEVEESCFNKNFNKRFHSTQYNTLNRQRKVFAVDALLEGKFKNLNVQLLAYNSSQGMSVIEFLESFVNESQIEGFVAVSNMQMLEVQRLRMDRQFYLADGALGLGFGEIQQDDVSEEDSKEDNQKDSENDDEAKKNSEVTDILNTDFVEQLVKQHTKLNLTKQQFAIYSYKKSKIIPDYVIQFGGFDYKYAHKRSQDIIWINIVSNSSYYWMVEIDKIGFKDWNKGVVSESDYVEPQYKRAILSLNTQFIEFPYKTLIQYMKKIQDLHTETTCELVDEDYILYCTKLHFPTQFQFFRLSFKFPTLDKIEEMDMSAFDLLVSNCTTHNDKNQSLQDCIFNIRASQTEYIILGEPFFRQHYMIFENQPGNSVKRIGILPSAGEQYYPEDISVWEWPLMRLIVYIFIFGIMSMCCVGNFKRCSKDVLRALRYRKAPRSAFEGAPIRGAKTYDEDMGEFQEPEQPHEGVELQLQKQEQQKQEEWQKSQQQFNFGSQFTQIVEDHSI